MDSDSTHLLGFQRIVAIGFEPIEADNETIFCNYCFNKQALKTDN